MSAFDDSSAPIEGAVTLASLALEGGVPEEVAAALWLNLDVDPLTDLEIAAAIPEDLVKEAFTTIRAELDFAPSVVGRLTILFTKIRARCAPAGSSTDGLARPKPAPMVRPVRRGNISAVLDQGDPEQYEHLDVAKQASLADQFYTTTGGPFPRDLEPTPEQLGALLAKLAKDDAPYADFAVFCPYGRRLARHRLFEAQVYVDGELRTKKFVGPVDFKAWEACWSLFSNAMIAVRAASPATLAAYKRGMQDLIEQYPGDNYWGVIYGADETLRSEVWARIAQNLRYEGQWPEEFCWDYVIQVSTYGGAVSTPEMSHWWKMHVEAPCRLAGTAAIKFVQELEGTNLFPTPKGYLTHQAGAQNYGGGGGNKKNKNTRPQPYAQPKQWQPPPQQWPKKQNKGQGKNPKGQGKNPKGQGKNPKGEGKGGKGGDGGWAAPSK